jgi:hypothetical protein
MKHTCRWILGETNKACGAPVAYRMVDDGGEPGAGKVRQYEPFCERHAALAKEIDGE